MFALVLNLWIWIGLLMLVMQVPRHHCTTTTHLGNETVTPTSSPPMSTDMQTTEDPTTTINLLVCARSSYVHTYFICHFIRHWSNTNENKMPIKIWILPITYQIDIRTDKFLEKFMISDKGSCVLFERHAEIGIKFSQRTVTSVQFQTWSMCDIDELFC